MHEVDLGSNSEDGEDSVHNEGESGDKDWQHENYRSSNHTVKLMVRTIIMITKIYSLYLLNDRWSMIVKDYWTMFW